MNTGPGSGSSHEHVPTDRDRLTVTTMAAAGIRQEDIARCLGNGGIDPKTLRVHYREELDTAGARATAAVAVSLHRKALGDGPQSVAACIFWLKTKGGWRETPQDINVGGQPGNPTRIELSWATAPLPLPAPAEPVDG